MVRLNHIFAIIATLFSLLLTSCDATIHFYPEAEEPNLPVEEQYNLIINEFYTGNDYSDLDTYTTIEHSRSKNEEMTQTRHIVQIFDMGNNLIDRVNII